MVLLKSTYPIRKKRGVPSITSIPLYLKITVKAQNVASSGTIDALAVLFMLFY
jgi:hypothetical protein